MGRLDDRRLTTVSLFASMNGDKNSTSDENKLNMAIEVAKVVDLVSQMQRKNCHMQDETFDKEFADLRFASSATNHDLLDKRHGKGEHSSSSIIDDIVELVYPMIEGRKIHLGVPPDTKL